MSAVAAGFPVRLDLAGRRVLVVGGGGGEAAAAACEGLLLAGALPEVVDPAPGEALEELAAEGALRLHRRAFRAADLEGVAFCHILPGPDAAAAAEEARRRGVLASLPAEAAPAAPARARGRASLVGAGPGDPELLTVKARRLIGEADVVLFDKLVGPEVLALARPDARRIDVGKRCGRHSMQQSAINRLILQHVRAGRHVVRLKGGDPFVFGRGGEELEALRGIGAEVEVVPGITASLAAAAGLRMPLTHRGASRSLHLLTAHGADDALPEHDWAALARAGGTLAFYMGVRTLPGVAARLLGAGMAPGTPVVAVENASLPGERHLAGTLGDIAARVAEWRPEGPTLVLVGAVAGLAEVGAEAARERDAA